MLDRGDFIPLRPDRPIQDFMGSREKAERLVLRIKNYWAKRGKFPKVYATKNKVVQIKNTPPIILHGDDLDGGVWVVRSDLKNGCPQ